MSGYTVLMMGEAVGKQRPKFNRNTGITYTPHKTVTFESTLKVLAQKELEKNNGKPFDKACCVQILVSKKVPDNWSIKKKVQYANQHFAVTVKPDIDNIAKSVLDALNGVLYTDDKLVSSLHIDKCYSDHDSVMVMCYGIGDKDEE